MRVTFRTTEK
uniref:Uncharacterized protein n=1 Tax=Anguilla anguilla TaxID=7936 RepID=A0A0E9QGD5_ANGAN